MRAAATVTCRCSPSPSSSDSAASATSSSAAAARSSGESAMALTTRPRQQGQPAVAQPATHGAQPRRLHRVVRHQHQRGAGGHARAQQRLHGGHRVRVQRAGRLVEQQHRRVERQGPQQRQALPLAGGAQRHRPREDVRRQPQRPRLRRREPGEVRAHPVLPPATLGRRVDHPPAPGRCRHRRASHPVQRRLAVMGVEVGDHAQHQALARPGRPGHRQARPRVEQQVERPRPLAPQAGQPQPRVCAPRGAGARHP